jgi:hypothetical protein
MPILMNDDGVLVILGEGDVFVGRGRPPEGGPVNELVFAEHTPLTTMIVEGTAQDVASDALGRTFRLQFTSADAATAFAADLFRVIIAMQQAETAQVSIKD